MGWSKFDERFRKGRLIYKCRLDDMERTNWVKRVCLARGYKGKWMTQCLNMANKVGLDTAHDSSIAGVNQWRIVLFQGDQHGYSPEELKPHIRRKVEEQGLKEWQKGLEKSTLELYRNKKCPKKESFYDGSWVSGLLFKARAGSLEVNFRTYRYNDGQTRRCPFCPGEEGDQETLLHLMVNCTAYEDIMDWAIDRYENELGQDGFREIRERDDFGLGYLLGFEAQYGRNVVKISKM